MGFPQNFLGLSFFGKVEGVPPKKRINNRFGGGEPGKGGGKGGGGRIREGKKKKGVFEVSSKKGSPRKEKSPKNPPPRGMGQKFFLGKTPKKP